LGFDTGSYLEVVNHQIDRCSKVVGYFTESFYDQEFLLNANRCGVKFVLEGITPDIEFSIDISKISCNEKILIEAYGNRFYAKDDKVHLHVENTKDGIFLSFSIENLPENRQTYFIAIPVGVKKSCMEIKRFAFTPRKDDCPRIEFLAS
jgi:hypothetical protein